MGTYEYFTYIALSCYALKSHITYSLGFYRWIVGIIWFDSIVGHFLGKQAWRFAVERDTQELKAGDQINVTPLSEQLALGRSPVHMAIHRLDREGLVDILPRKGILVRSETLESFFELINARLLVEPYLVELLVIP